MNAIKTNKTNSLIILLQLISIFTLLSSSCGETTNKEKQMENKSKFTAIESETKEAGIPPSMILLH